MPLCGERVAGGRRQLLASQPTPAEGPVGGQALPLVTLRRLIAVLKIAGRSSEEVGEGGFLLAVPVHWIQRGNGKVA